MMSIFKKVFFISKISKTLTKALFFIGAALMCVTANGLARAQGTTAAPAATPLTPPFLLKREERRQSNYLAQYLELQRLEKQYRADEDFIDRYLQSRGFTASILGDVREANLLFDETFGLLSNKPSKPLERSPLADLQPTDAEAFLLKAADAHRVIMINDGHHQPQTRVLPTRLLRGLYAKGFRYLALETLAEELDTEALAKRKYLLATDGTMTNEPAFGDLVRQALAIGYKLVPYEFPGESRPGESMIDRKNRREIEEAQNIKARVFDRDPNAKLLLIGGQSHISEKSILMTGEPKPWTMMAMRFKELTGIDPFTVDQQTMLSHSRPEAEPEIYRDAVSRGLVKDHAVVFTDAGGKSWTRPTAGLNVDAQVFLPPVNFVKERPDWLARDLKRISYKIPKKLLTTCDVCVVQAFFEGEPGNAVPVDQILVRAAQPIPALMLPRRKTFWLRQIDSSGREKIIKRINK